MADQDQDKQGKSCPGCGKPLVGDSGDEHGREGEIHCPQCMIERAEKYIEDRSVGAVEKSGLKRLRETMAWKIALVVVLCACLGIIVYQFPRLLASFKGPQPIRMGGTYATDATTDKCIIISGSLSMSFSRAKRGPVRPWFVRPAASLIRSSRGQTRKYIARIRGATVSGILWFRRRIPCRS